MLGIDRRAARYTWTVAVVVLLFVLAYLIRTTVFVFILALLFGYLLSPLVNVIDRFLPGKGTRTPALAIAYIIFLTLLFLALTQIGGRVVDEANSLAKSLPPTLAKFQQPSSGLPPAVNSLRAQVIQKVQEQIARSSGDIIASLPRAGAKIISIASNLVFVVVVPILGFFFLKDGAAIREHFLEMIENPAQRAVVNDLLAEINLLLAHYMRAILLLSLATFTCYSIFFTILSVPYAILLAALAAILEFIPMIGPLTASAFIIVVTAVSGGPVLIALIFLIVYRLFQDYVLAPHLMRVGIQLHPLLVLFGLFAGAEIAGIPGAFLSVPVLALVRIVFRRIRRERTVLDPVPTTL